MRKTFKSILVLVCLLFLLVMPYFVFATGPLDNLKKVGSDSGYSESATVGSMANTVITASLSLLGIIFIGLIIFAGFKYMTAGGNEEEVKKAISLIRNAVIGLIIVLSAYAITNFVFSRLAGGSGTGGTSGYTETGS